MSLSKKDGDVLMEKVVLYIGLTDEENKALSTEEIESILSKRDLILNLEKKLKDKKDKISKPKI